MQPRSLNITIDNTSNITKIHIASPSFGLYSISPLMVSISIFSQSINVVFQLASKQNTYRMTPCVITDWTCEALAITYALVVLSLQFRYGLISKDFRDSRKLFVYCESCPWNYHVLKKMIPRYIYERLGHVRLGFIYK